MKFLMILMLLTSQIAFAEDIVKSNELRCYGREYSSAHLKSHPKQTVQKIQVKFENEKEFNSNWMKLEVTLKGEENEYINYKAFFVSTGLKNTWGIECDGGRVTASLNNKGNLVLKNEGFILKGGCSGDDDSKDVYLESIEGGDDTFELVRLPRAFCQSTLVE